MKIVKSILSTFVIMSFLLSNCAHTSDIPYTATEENTQVIKIETPLDIVDEVEVEDIKVETENIETTAEPFVCTHSSHDRETIICDECSEYVYHEYVDGSCKYCGCRPYFVFDQLPDNYFAEAANQGSVETVKVFGVDVTIYTPHGYNTNNQYNVLVFQHGRLGLSTSFISMEHAIDGGTISGRQLYDHLIEDHLIKPMIIVSFTSTYVDNSSEYVRYRLIPYIVNNYSTYAENDSTEALINAREHFGFGGYSLGGFLTYTMMRTNTDIFSNFMPCAGGFEQDDIWYDLNNCFSDYPINSYFVGCGYQDEGLRIYRELFNITTGCSQNLTLDKNSFISIAQHGHDMDNAFLSLYCGLQYMFQEIS